VPTLSAVLRNAVPEYEVVSKVLNVLFLCTGNSARSIMAEGLLDKLGAGRFKGYSAGNHPSGKVNPFALQMLQQAGCSIEGARSKSWEEFAAPGAPRMDIIITVCDNAAGEVCPVWPGHPATAHWSYPDPAAVAGRDEVKRAAFAKVFEQIRRQIHMLAALEPEKLERLALEQHVRKIGKL
jgi:arsenate reductase (thioredoxin)